MNNLTRYFSGFFLGALLENLILVGPNVINIVIIIFMVFVIAIDFLYKDEENIK